MTFPLWRRRWRTTPPKPARTLFMLALTWSCPTVRSTFSLMPNDQTNIDSMFAAITLGASEYPYHPDGGKCVMYSAADIITLYSEYKSFVTKQTTYCNALRQWAKRETDPNVIGSIYYGCALPEDLEKEVGDILSAAQAQITAIINKLSA